MKFIYYVTICLLGVSLAGQPARADRLVSIAVDVRQEIITLHLSRTAPHKVFALENPDRLVVDVPAIPGQPEVSLPSSYNGTLIKAVRYGRFTREVSRFVFDLKKPVRVTGVERQPGGLTVGIEATGRPKEKAYPVDLPPEKPLIVIDPGHGGADPGTIGRGGSREKDLVLQYAKTLKEKLLKTGRYEVLLTREDDRSLVLRKRIDMARKVRAALFISLHADSAPARSARGLSVYTLSEQASDEETAALAVQENKADLLVGIDLSEEDDDVAGILLSLAERETMNRSATLADLLVTRLDELVQLLPNTHRFAGFAVLKAPDIPSVLIEIGFLSHAQEEKLIKTRAHREKVTSGIVDGIDAYFKHMKKMDRR